MAVNWRGSCSIREPGPPLKNLVISVAGPLVKAILILAWRSASRISASPLSTFFKSNNPMDCERWNINLDVSETARLPQIYRAIGISRPGPKVLGRMIGM